MNCQLENQYKDKGFNCICGVDEVGLGCIAGPVVAAAVVLNLPSACSIEVTSGKKTYPIGDSKQIPIEAREKLYPLILKDSLAVGIGVATIEELNNAAFHGGKPLAIGGDLARCRAVENLCKKMGNKFPHEKIALLHFQMTNLVIKAKVNPDLALIDHFLLKGLSTPESIGITKGDTKVISIAAASIIAKVCRDRYMANLAIQFDSYNWEKNKGYATPKHIQGLKEFGPSAHHRTFMLNSVLS